MQWGQGLWKPSGQGSSRQDQLLAVAIPAKVVLLSFSKEIAPRPPTSASPGGQRTTLVWTGWADWSSSCAVWLWWAVIESWEKRPSEHQEEMPLQFASLSENPTTICQLPTNRFVREKGPSLLYSPPAHSDLERDFSCKGPWDIIASVLSWACSPRSGEQVPVWHLQPLLGKKNRDWVPLLTAGLVVLLVEGAEKSKWIGFQFLSAYCHLPPQICALIFMDTFNPFGPRMFQSQYKLFVGFVGNLVVSICRCSLSVSLENFYSGSWFSWHLIFLSMNYIGTWQIIFSPFAFVAREPRANHLILTV